MSTVHPISKRIIEHCSQAQWFAGDDENDSHFSEHKKLKELKAFEYPPATEHDLIAAEKKMGTALPPLLRKILLEVANGHFGPGYGLYGIPSIGSLECKLSLDMVKEHAERSEYWWPTGLLPICYFGCTIVSAIFVPDGRIVRYDYSDLDCDYVYFEDDSFENWLNAWMKGDDMFNRLQTEPLPKFP